MRFLYAALLLFLHSNLTGIATHVHPPEIKDSLQTALNKAEKVEDQIRILGELGKYYIDYEAGKEKLFDSLHLRAIQLAKENYDDDLQLNTINNYLSQLEGSHDLKSLLPLIIRAEELVKTKENNAIRLDTWLAISNAYLI